MTKRKTNKFLPEIFQTEVNQKFLGATLDQLVSEPNFENIFGYIGRKFAPTYKSGDTYIKENSQQRTDYQLEPSVVVKNQKNEIEFLADYQDLLNQIENNGGSITDHSRLFEQEFYSFDPKISYDKIINYSQYYWLPNGPDPVNVTTEGLLSRQTLTVKRDLTANEYVFESNGVVVTNLVLSRGGIYEFIVDQPGHPFWIQTELGVDGTLNAVPSVSSRTVVGVENNGIDSGTVTFRVPQITAQDRFVTMPLIYNVDRITTIPYSKLQNQNEQSFLENYPEYDGKINQLIDKYVVFKVNDSWNNLGEGAWTNPVVKDNDGEIIPNFNAGTVISESNRFGVWKITQQSIGQKVHISQPLTANLTAGTRLTVQSNLAVVSASSAYNFEVPLLYDATVGQDYIYVSETVQWPGPSNLTVRQSDVITSLISTESTGNVVTVTSTFGMTPNMPLTFTGSNVGTIVNLTTYYVKNILGPTTLTISASPGGPEYVQTNSSGIMTVTGKYQTIPIGTNITAVSNGGNIFRLVFVTGVNIDQKVFVRYGLDEANKEFYRDYDGVYKPVPLITATLDTLYIQDISIGTLYKKIRVVDSGNWQINVEEDIIGQLNYTSPNGVQFTSGLKVEFGPTALPSQYQNRQFYVEQVGDLDTGIQLIPVDELVAPETYYDALDANFPGEIFPDYITINRASIDRNPWSRSNRWFHIEIINAAAKYNNNIPQFDGAVRGQRPIIQFEKNYKLFNFGTVGKTPIDILDVKFTNAFRELQGQSFTTVFGLEIIDADGNPIYPNGLRVVFANDQDPLVRNKIFDLILVQYEETNNQPSGPLRIELSLAADGNVLPNETTVVKQGIYRGKSIWFDGEQWLYSDATSQQKTTLQQPPLYDVVDTEGRSFASYSRSTFKGTPVFGYLRGTRGVADPILSKGIVQSITDESNNLITDFYLTYKSFTTQGDIIFKNYFNSDTFEYTNPAGDTVITQNINLGFLQKIQDINNVSFSNLWLKIAEPSHQYQIISYVYDGENNKFEIDVEPDTNQTTIPYLKVFCNFKYIQPTEYTYQNKVITLTTKPIVGDQVDILVYSPEISKLGYYQVPLNLDLNPQNIDLSQLTLGQIRFHVVSLGQNSLSLKGNILAESNLRDIDIKQQGGTILQHSSPLPFASLFLIDKQANFINALRYTQQEYTKFKNKFLELSLSLPGIDPNNPVSSVDLILTKINQNKNKGFPWYYSDMVPYGPLKSIVGQIDDLDGIRIFDPLKTNYEITEIFDDEKLSNKSILVYLNGQQLLKNIDYRFNRQTPSIDFLVPLEVNDILQIVEYENTDGNYIPETPSKLGLWFTYKPERFYDNTYRTPTYVIRGHDGSITPTFNDYRDEFLLELEKRIYNNIKLPNNDIFKTLYQVLPGKFRNTDYNLTEFNQILGTALLNWAGNNKLDYSVNDTFQSNDSFTWNYGQSTDKIDSEDLPGSWRACYQYFYDTYRPHLTPWEMLGFTIEPDWWEGFYGPAPYSGKNALLWQDLEEGRIRYGARQGIDIYYARPGLSQCIPVDENGNLLPPVTVLSKNFNGRRAASAWSIGQQGPIEFAWRTSSEFPYAAIQALALLKPARFFGSLIDTGNYSTNNVLKTSTNQQFLMSNSNKHITQSQIKFNGFTSNNEVYRTAGYLNFISEYLIGRGVSPTVYLVNLIEKFQVNLTYKVGGFTDQNMLEVLAEQLNPSNISNNVLIPNENYRVYLNEQPVPIDRITYSAVIVTKTNNGYSVRGYNLVDSFFTVIPSIINNNAFKISVLNTSVTVFNDFQNLNVRIPYGFEFTSLQQVADFLISYERYLIAQGFVFNDIEPELGQVKNWKLSVREFLYWAQQGWRPGSILVLSPVSNAINIVTLNAVTQGIADSQYNSRVVDQNFNLIKNNNYSVNRTSTDCKITLDNAASVIGYVELNLVQYEHTLVFDNLTVFNDVIYQPETGDRQYRLKLIGQRTADWDGNLSPEGYIYNSGKVNDWIPAKDFLKGDLVIYKDKLYSALQDIPAASTFQWTSWVPLDIKNLKKGLLPNYSTLALQSQSYYDSYGQFRSQKQLDYSHALIGYKKRQYLTDLGLSTTSQIEFYKGFIAQKGTKNAVDAFISANVNNLTSSINFYEEWAIRVGEYGALDSNSYVEVPIDEKTFGLNPSLLTFVDLPDNNLANGLDSFNVFQVHKLSGEYSANIALYRSGISDYDNDIPTAGYVNIDDVDVQIYDLTNYLNLNEDLAEIGSGYRIWTAKDFDQRWNVYRVTETNNQIIAITNNLNNFITITTRLFHELKIDDVFLIKNFNSNFDGFYRVVRIVDPFNVLVSLTRRVQNFTVLEGNGILLRLDTMRFRYMEDARIYGLSNPPNGWKVGDKIWIDDDAETTEEQGQPFGTQPSGTWKVYEKQEPWVLKQEVLKSTVEYSNTDAYGTTVRMSPDGLMIAVGTPNYQSTVAFQNYGNVGQVKTWLKDFESNFVESFSISPTDSNVRAFGHSIDIAYDGNETYYMAVGAPDSFTGNGLVYIYSRNINSQFFEPRGVLQGNGFNDNFGYSLTFNRDGDWLYIGAPNNNSVYVYGLSRFTPRREQVFSINNRYRIFLSANINATVSDTIVQGSTGARARIESFISNSEIIVDTLTDFVYALPGSDGNVINGNTTILSNLSVLSSGNLEVTQIYPTGFHSNAYIDARNLDFTPASSDANCLVITDSSGKIYVPGREFVLNGNQVKFASNVETTTLRVVQQPFYSHLQTLTVPSGNSWARFGYALSSSYDGAQLAVGAPGETVADINGTLQPGAGAVYVYDRSIEAFKTVLDAVSGTGGQDYKTVETMANITKVLIDNVEVNNYFKIDNRTLRFVVPPALGQTLFVEVNQFKLLETIVGVDSLEGGLAAIQANAAFGSSLTICSNNCAIYIGAPNYDNGTNYNTGAVWKFHNKGRLYGTNRGFNKDPLFKPVDTIRLNNFEVRVSLGLSATASISEGSYITQPSTGANVRVLKTVNLSNSVVVSEYLNSNVFAMGGNIAVNGSWLNPNVSVRLTNLDEFVQDINNSKIVGVTAENENGNLRINSDVKVSKDQLRILSGTTTSGSLGVTNESGLIVFAFMQIIINPFGLAGEYFGTKVKLASNAYQLIIGSDQGTTVNLTTFDQEQLSGVTKFDDDTTRFKDTFFGTGAVYIYELYDDPRNEVENPGRYAYVQQLIPPNLEDLSREKFGFAIDIEKNNIIVSAPRATAPNSRTDAGSIYVYNNPTNSRGWRLIRYQQPQVDLSSISRLYLYDKQTNLIKENLQVIDPAKGRILGQAEQEISFRTEYDPAIYNRGNNENVAIKQETYWGELQVGKVWWNLSKVRYLDYQQDTLIYRTLHWGELFKGSIIEVCEWVSSLYPPSQYVDNGGEGVPLYADDSAYVEQIVIDPITGIAGFRFYFWVKDKTTVDSLDKTRRLSIKAISDYISNPKTQGFPYAAIVKGNAIALYNVSNYLSADNTILHIDYQTKLNSDIIHSEYELIQKDNPDSLLPGKIVAKFIDSLSGIDAQTNPVPDPRLNDYSRYGISFRPRQTMFVNRLAALQELVNYVNSVFELHPIAQQFDLRGFKAQDPEPNIKLDEYDLKVTTEIELDYIETTFLSTGYTVLVENDTTQSGLWVLYELTSTKQWQIIKVQAFKTELYWEYSDWYAAGYSAFTKPDFSVETTVNAIALAAVPGSVIYIRNATGDNTWQLAEVEQGNNLKIVGIQNGTVQLKSSLYNFNETGFGFSNQDFDADRYDQNPNIEIRYILRDLYEHIFRNTLQGEFNKLFFVMTNYLLSEQNSTDWIFKSSFVNITHKIRQLKQFPSFILDNQNYYQQYIEEVKPYRTKIREYRLNYVGDDRFDGDITDFDLPPYWDTFGIDPGFRSPSGEPPFTSLDERKWQIWPYNQWYNNRTLEVFRIQVENSGANYALPPLITIVSTDGRGQGATAEAIVDGNTGAISNIRVTNSGIGYTSTPRVIINGSSDTPATAYPVMYNPKVRSFDSKLKFDRIKYNSNVKVWSANTSYIKTEFDEDGRVTGGDIITHAQLDGNVVIRKAYFVKSNITTTSTFLAEDYTPCPPSYFDNANDRILGYYQPTNTMPVVDTISSIITLVNAAVETDTIYVFTAEDMTKNMYINQGSVESAYITEIVGNVSTMINPRGYFFANLSNGSTSLENISSMDDLTLKQTIRPDGVSNVYTLSANTTTTDIIVSINGTANLSYSVFYGNVTRPYGNVIRPRLAFTFPGNALSSNDTIEVRYKYVGLTGSYVLGEGIPYETVITSVNYSTNSINLSDQVTANVVAANIQFGGLPTKISQVKLSSNVTLDENQSIVGRFDSLEQLVPGVDYPYAVTRGVNFKITTSFGRNFDIPPYDPVQFSQDGIALLSTNIYDQALYSLYANLALGVSPEEFSTVGGKFIDSYHSRAPEELVPGTMFDTLDMRVYTRIESNAKTVGFRIFENMMDEAAYLRISTAHTALLTRDLNLTDEYIHVANAAAFTAPEPIRAKPGIIFINGERITFYRSYRHEVTPWVQGQSYDADRPLSYGLDYYLTTRSIDSESFDELLRYEIRLQGNITANVGSHLTQFGSNANAVIVAANVINSNVVVVQYLTQPTQFTMNGGNLYINGELIRPSNVIVRATTYGGNVIRVNNTLGLYVGMHANIGFDSNARIETIYANANIVMSSANIISLNQTSISFGDVGSGNSTSTGAGVYPTLESGNLRLLEDINVLTQIRRGTQGTSAYAVHPVFSQAVDGGTGEILPQTTYGNLFANVNVLLNSGNVANVAADGTGIEGSTTLAALFLKAADVNANLLPGVNAALTTEDAINIQSEGGRNLYTEG